MWMKIQTVHDDSRSGDVDASDVCYRFLAFDLSDGSLFYQEAAAFSNISKLVQVRRHFRDRWRLGYRTSTVAFQP